MDIDHDALRDRASRLGVHIGICFTYEDKLRLQNCESDDDFLAAIQDIHESISGVYRANLKGNHSNFKGLR